MVMPVSGYDLWLGLWEDYFDVDVPRNWYDVWGVEAVYDQIKGHYFGGFDPDPEPTLTLSEMVRRALAAGDPVPKSPARILSEQPTSELMRWHALWVRYKETVFPTLAAAKAAGLQTVVNELSLVLELTAINEALLSLAIKASESLSGSWSKAREKQMHDLWNQEAIRYSVLLN